MSWWTVLAERLAQAPPGSVVGGGVLGGWLGVAAAAVLVPQSWGWFRLGVTLVHELGHALVGVAAGRRFTGFAVRADMSGHAVTSGPSRGAGRVATTWAGYPAPGLVGLLMVWCGVHGWAGALLGTLLLVLVAVTVFVRSGLTLLIVVAVTAGVGALWWWRSDAVQSGAVIAVGCALLVGAWRHLLAVASTAGQDRSSDPAVLASLTRVPSAIWLLSYAVTLGWCVWAAGRLVLAAW